MNNPSSKEVAAKLAAAVADAQSFTLHFRGDTGVVRVLIGNNVIARYIDPYEAFRELGINILEGVE